MDVPYMEILITLLIVVGALNMAGNIIRYHRFLVSCEDVLSSGKKSDRMWMLLAQVLLIFFLIGYHFVGFFSKPDLMVALILFFGSIFVTIVETLMFKLIETAKERSIDVAEVLVGVIDARDPFLNGHSRHVQELTMLFYRYLPRDIRKNLNPVSLEYAALLHDVGKLGVPEAILNKPAKLNPEEWEVVVRHPATGVKILKPLHSFDNITDWILYHHERVDGKGYYRLSEDEIPLAARVISIADTYSAITMQRAYKLPRTHEDAISAMREVAGAQLDRELLDVFCSIPKEELQKCIPQRVNYSEAVEDLNPPFVPESSVKKPS